MTVRVRGDLRQVRDDDDLVGTCQPGMAPADLDRGATADACVDLVEHHRGAFDRRGEYHFERQHDSGQFAA